ncbi:hypothetical protein GCM10009816_27400 [Microbacterium aquimaris]
MDYGFASHVILWVVGAVAAVGGLGVVLAVFSMGRQGYHD